MSATNQSNTKPVILTCAQPTGKLTLGNYLGAIKNFVDLQNQKETECVYCIVDLHAITVKQEPKEFKSKHEKQIYIEFNLLLILYHYLIKQPDRY